MHFSEANTLLLGSHLSFDLPRSSYREDFEIADCWRANPVVHDFTRHPTAFHLLTSPPILLISHRFDLISFDSVFGSHTTL